MKRVSLLAIAVVMTALAQTGGRYIIITPDAFYNSILPLAQWKHATGMKCVVTRLSEIGNDTTAIKNYIRNAYNTWTIRPECVLLVGSQSLLPARQYTRQGWVYVSSDNIYGDVNGDTVAELAVGRLPAYTTAQLDAMVAKTLAYERTPDLTDSIWMCRLTTVVREAGDPDDTIYWSNVRRAAQQAAAAGFVSVDSLSAARGDDAMDIITSVNNGTGFVLYRGTANGTWYPPFSVRPSLVTTPNKLPIVLSITCATMTLTPGEQMLGDSWMRTGTATIPRGAVAFFGNTYSASDVAPVRGAVCRGFFDGLFLEGVYKLGWTCLRAKQQLRLEYPNYVSDYRGFNLLGDPDLGIWTATPYLPTVTHPTSIAPGPQTFPVTVMRGTVPIQGALVCASKDSSVYAYGYTNSQGSVSLAINPSDTGRLRLVVTGKNIYPYDVTVPIGYTGIADAKQTTLDHFTVTPTVCRRGEPVRITSASSTRVQIVDASGRLVWAGFVPTSWYGLELDGRYLGAGVYFVLEDSGNGMGSRVRVVRLP